MVTRSTVDDTTLAGRRWAEALESWAIPEDILEQAPADPWVMPPKLFRAEPDDPTDSPSYRIARMLLGPRGSVLDVGCGGGRASLPLADQLTEAIGTDQRQEMLDQFAEAAAARDVPARTFAATWPDDAGEVPDADLVVCHHVVYNVPAIDGFVRALSAHARNGVVVELPVRHPLSPMSHLWKRFWDLDRPTEPSSELFVAVVRANGWEPRVETHLRPPRRAGKLDDDELVAFTRQRLCLPESRDDEVRAALDAEPDPGPSEVATVWWRTSVPS